MSCTNTLRLTLYATIVTSTAGCVGGESATESALEEDAVLDTHWNADGKSASYSPLGPITHTGAFFTPQGTNGRSCVTCHASEDGWSLTPETARHMFDETGGLHPLFSRLDADRPGMTTAQLAAMSVGERAQVFTMLLAGKFTRSVTVPVTRDYEVVGASDPFGVGTTAKLWFFRRPLPSANFKSQTVMWDAANTIAGDLYAGLVKQARGNVTGAQEGLPATDATIFEIVDFEATLSNAQIVTRSVGRLDADGARGGPIYHAEQPLVEGRFDLYDAWENSDNALRRQIYRGQQLFNNGGANGKRCSGCHNAANDGANVAGTLFDIGASNPMFADMNMAVYTFQRISDAAVVQSTDPGRGIRTGRFADLNKFKTPSLRGLAARPPYFHNGIAATLEEAVAFYEQSLGFDFTPEQEADLVAFLKAL